MRGAEHIVELRQRGRAPVLVFVDTNATGIVDAKQRLEGDDSAMLWIEPTDNVARLDLRFMVGLQASVTGCSAERVGEVAAAMLQHKARRVMAAVLRQDRADGYEVVSQTDTDGDYTWSDAY